MSIDRGLALLVLLALACAKPSDELEYSEDDADWPEPELCEVRQIKIDGDLAGPGDLVATCDDEGTRVVAFHRPAPVECTTGYDACDIADLCNASECQAYLGPSARCIAHAGGCECVVPCVTDTDCAADEACVCRSGTNLQGGLAPVTTLSASVAMCSPAECRTDAECGSDATCAIPSSLCPYRPHLWCKPVDASCLDDEACPPGQGCFPTGEGDWACVDAGCGP